MNTEEKFQLAKKLLQEVEIEKKEKIKEEHKQHKCKCGHVRGQHGISYSINYTQGFCKICECQYFLQS